MESNAFEIFTNNSVDTRFFAHIHSLIQMYNMMKEEPQHLKNTYVLFYSFERGQISVGVLETDGRRETRRIAILTHNFFSSPYHAMLSSRFHLALLLFYGQWRENQSEARCGPLCWPQPHCALSVTALSHWTAS